MQASAPSCSGATKNRTYGGRILATGNYPSASTAGPLSPPAAPLLTYYSASKLAVIGLVQAAANELAPASTPSMRSTPATCGPSMQERELVWGAGLRNITLE